MSTSTHSSQEQSGIGMNFQETSQKQAPWKSSGPVLPDSWSTDPCLQQGVKIVHSFSQVFNKFWDNCCFTRFTQFRLIPVLYLEEEEEEEEETMDVRKARKIVMKSDIV